MLYAVIAAKAYANIRMTVVRSSGRTSTIFDRRVERAVVRLVVTITSGVGERDDCDYDGAPTASAAGESGQTAEGVATYSEWASWLWKNAVWDA